MPSFSQRLAKFMDENDLSQGQMGEILGVTGKYVGMLVRGDKEVNDDSTISRLLALYEANGMPSREPYVSNEARFRMKEARLRKNWSIKDLAQKTGYSIGYLHALEETGAGASEKAIEAICKALGLDKDDLMGGSEVLISDNPVFGTVGAKPNITQGPGVENARYVPLISFAQAGSMVSFDDQIYSHEGVIGFDIKDRKAFASKIRGDSMQPVYGEGDIILVSPSQPPRNNRLVMARLNDDTPGHGGDVMFKIFTSNPSGRVVLSSYNPAYSPMDFSRTDFQWIYPVVQVIKTFD